MCLQSVFLTDDGVNLRSAHNVHGSDLVSAPAHGHEGGVVVTQLRVAAQEVLLLIDHHATALVRLQDQDRER